MTGFLNGGYEKGKMTTISIIDDNTSILTSLSLQFQSQGYKTITFADPQEALEHHAQNPADAYIIDMKMPKLTGFEFYSQLCESLKKDRVPALFLTAVDNLEERALKETTIGDYVLKPFSFNILIARLEKVLSYFKRKEEDKSYKIGNLEMMEDKILCRWFGVEIELTRTEFSLLYRLVKRPRVVYSRDQLLDVCYSDDLDVTDRNIDSHIKRLRKKFREANPKIKFDRIRTHYGTGYAWTPQSA
jgi:two-component system response regulator ChvI